MNIKDALRIKETTSQSVSELKEMAICSELAFSSLLEGVGAIGTLLFETSCNENDKISKDTLGEIGLLINQVALIAGAVNENMHDAIEEIKRRSAPPSIKTVSYQKISYMVLLGILIMLSFLSINLKVTYTKMNQTPQRYMHN